MLKSDRLVCEKNATKAQPVTNCNLGSINYVYFNYKVNLLIGREKIFATLDMVKVYHNTKTEVSNSTAS